ncbi:MAG TPA: response regulator transcription factor [Actinomycetota bacterium]|nr:response regulator transcription factor [Actinomycetota bacterium]
MAGERILVVDDEPTVREVVQHYLEREGYRVQAAENGPAALAAFSAGAPDLIVLDLMLPGVDGLEVCRQVRATDSTPIIILTAKGHEADRIVGLELGADDYVVKPFSPRELVARVRSVLRRTLAGDGRGPAPPLRAGDVQVDPVTREVTVAGRPIALTVREFDLLAFLVAHPRQVFSRGQLLRQVWEYNWLGDTSTVTVHMRRLRAKVEDDPSNPLRLQTVYGVGYRLVPVEP